MKWREAVLSRRRMLTNALRSRSSRGRGHPLLGLVLAIVLALLLSRALSAVFAIVSTSGLSEFQAGTLLGLVLSGLLAGLLVFDLHEAVSTLIIDSDLELLRRAPISRRALFLLKLIDALPRTSLLIAILGVPAVIAFSEHFPLPWWAWPMLLVQLVALWAIPVGLGAAGAVRLLCVVPAKRAREVLGLVSVMVFVLLWLANSFLLPRIAASQAGSSERIEAMLAHPPLLLRISPGHWAGQSMSAAAEGLIVEALVGTLLLLTVAAVTLTFAAWTGARHLETAQARIASGGSRRPRRATRALRGRGFVGAAVTRDLKLLMRDWSVLGDVLTGVVLWTLLPLVTMPVLETPMAFFAQAMMVLLPVALGYEIAARLVPLEREAIHWSRLSPVPPWRWIAAKGVTGLLISFPLVIVATAALSWSFKLPIDDLMLGLTVSMPALVLSLAIGLWTGVTFGRTDWKSPRAMLGLAGRLLAMGLLVGQAGAWLIYLFIITDPAAPVPWPTWSGPLAALVLAVPAIAATAATFARRET